MFDVVCATFPTMSSHLGTDAEIIQDKHFETGIVKVQSHSKILNAIEKKWLSHLLQPAPVAEPTSSTETLDFVGSTQSQRKKPKVYEDDLDWIPPTSNMRLFILTCQVDHESPSYLYVTLSF